METQQHCCDDFDDFILVQPGFPRQTRRGFLEPGVFPRELGAEPPGSGRSSVIRFSQKRAEHLKIGPLPPSLAGPTGAAAS